MIGATKQNKLNELDRRAATALARLASSSPGDTGEYATKIDAVLDVIEAVASKTVGAGGGSKAVAYGIAAAAMGVLEEICRESGVCRPFVRTSDEYTPQPLTRKQVLGVLRRAQVDYPPLYIRGVSAAWLEFLELNVHTIEVETATPNSAKTPVLVNLTQLQAEFPELSDRDLGDLRRRMTPAELRGLSTSGSR